MKQNTCDQATENDPELKAQLGDLVTMRLIHFFSVMRRSGVLAQRRVFGMSEAEWRILTQVGANAPLSLNRLAELTLQDRGQLSRTVKGMVERGLLNRERRPGGPTVDISLAPAGRELHARMIDRALQRDQRLTQDISPADDAALRRIVEQMITRAEEMLEEERALS